MFQIPHGFSLVKRSVERRSTVTISRPLPGKPARPQLEPH